MRNDVRIRGSGCGDHHHDHALSDDENAFSILDI
jgi:hypothetical protein